MATTWQKFNLFVDYLAKGGVNLASDTIKCMLTNTAPTATLSKYSDVSGNELANGNGYTTGGTAVGGLALSNNAGVESLSDSQVVFTSANGNMGPFRYAIFYDSSAANQPLIGFYDYGSSVTLNGAASETFTVNTGGNLLTLT